MAADQLQTVVQRMIDAGEAEDNIATVIRHFTAPVERGGLEHPLTSVVAPEVHAVRSAMNAALPDVSETPIERVNPKTGTRYPSALGTAKGAVTGLARGVGGELLNQAEFATSPLGVAAIATPFLFRPAQAVGRLVMRGVKAIDPADAVGMVSPRAGNAITVARQVRGALKAAPEEAAPAAHLDRSIPMRPSEMTLEQMHERATQGYGVAAPTRRAVRGRLTMPEPQSAPPSVLQQPRVDVGAEKVGRELGWTKEQVRAQTGPILGEAPGAASPILPEKALQKIIDTMKALPKEGGAREAYVHAATSGKAQWQIENLRRTLEHLGLLVPIAAGTAYASQQP